MSPRFTISPLTLTLPLLFAGGALAAKYQEWFPWYVFRDNTLPYVSREICKEQYDGYMATLTNPDGKFKGEGPLQWCVRNDYH